MGKTRRALSPELQNPDHQGLEVPRLFQIHFVECLVDSGNPLVTDSAQTSRVAEQIR